MLNSRRFCAESSALNQHFPQPPPAPPWHKGLDDLMLDCGDVLGGSWPGKGRQEVKGSVFRVVGDGLSLRSRASCAGEG